MKKLIIAASIAMVGIALNAASYDWTCKATTFVKDAKTVGAYAGYASYFFDSAELTSVTAALALGDISVLSDALGYGVVKSTGGINFKSTDNAAFSKISDDGATPDAYAHGFMVVLNNETAADATEYYVSAVKDVKITDAVISGGATFSYGNIIAPEWNTMAIPEPTSGLLLLLGVAGLALKRRHA